MKSKNYCSMMTTLLMAIVISISFTACGNDDSDDNGGHTAGKAVTVENLKGVWELCHVKGSTLNEDDEFITFDRDVTTSAQDLAWLEQADFMDFVRYEFTTDSRFLCHTYQGGTFHQTASCDFTISGQTIYFVYARHSEQAQVSSLTDTELIIHDSISEEGYDVYATFRKVN